MKSLFLFLAATLSLFAANSQVLFSEDFDGIPGPTAGGAGTYTFPSGWFLRNVDNRTPDAQTAYVNEAWERREDFGTNVGDSVAFSTSYYSPVGQADDWMWTPLIGPIGPAAVLQWNARAYDPAWPDGYEVRVMVAASGPPTGGTGVLGNQVTNSTVIFSTTSESSSWTPHEVPLNAYAGQSIYIGFRNNSTDKFLLVVDDIVVQNVVNHDLGVSNVSHGPYTASPAQHQTTTANFELKGRLTNYGLQSMTNARLACDVIVNGTLLTTVQSTPMTLTAGNNATVTIPFTPTADGTYTFEFYPMADEADEQSNNDTMPDATPLTIHPLTMRRDLGGATQSVGIGANQLGYIAQTFRFETAVNIAAIETYLTRGYATRQLRGAIFATNGSGVPTSIVALTDTLIYPDDSARLYTMPIYGGTLTLPAGVYAFAQVEIDSTIQLGMTNNIYTPNTVFVQWPGGGANFNPIENFPSNFHKTLMLYPVFDLCFGETGGSPDTATQASCGLNDGTATLTMDAGYSVLWEDSTTTAVHNQLAAGWHTFTISNAYCSFTDSVEITNPNAPTAMVDSIANAPCFMENGTITLDIQGDASPYTVIWSDESTDEVFTGPAGTYSVTITDTNNCSVTVSDATITAPSSLTLAMEMNPALCAGGEGSLLLDVGGGTAPYTITWQDNSTGETYAGPAGTYSATITDDNGCQLEVVAAVITEPAALTATVSSTDETCHSCDDGTATVAPEGGVAPYSVLWSNGETGSPIQELEPGTYSAVITDANGCTYETDSFEIAPYVVGINELNLYGISVFPNPVSDYLTVTSDKNDVLSVMLIDASGKVIAESAKTNHTFTADMRNLAAGTYRLIIRLETETIVTAVAKQ